MLYCPKCCAIQHDQRTAICRKCGYDFLEHEKRLREEEARKAQMMQSLDEGEFGKYDSSFPCPRCGKPTRHVERMVEIPVEGNRISIQGLKMMGSELTKRTVTMYSINVTGKECPSGHKFYDKIAPREKPLCPTCSAPLIKYGTAILSCNKCNKHFSLSDWVKKDAFELIRTEGWEPVSECSPGGNV